jgi:hypothetical protein
MSAALIILLLIATAALIGRGLANAVKNDGYGHPSTGRTPPRSHVPDPFEPTRFA